MNDNLEEDRFLENESKNNYILKNNKLSKNEIYENEPYNFFELSKREENIANL